MAMESTSWASPWARSMIVPMRSPATAPATAPMTIRVKGSVTPFTQAMPAA